MQVTIFNLPSLKLTESLKINGWKIEFPFRMAYFPQRTVSFKECTI